MATGDKTVHVQYFALLREQRGLSSETLSTSANRAEELFEELRQTHKFSLPAHNLRVSINDRFEKWDKELRDQDRIVFIPPVAGG